MMIKAKKNRWGIKIAAAVAVLAGLIIVGLTGLDGYLTRKWDGRQRFTIVELSNPVTISSFDPAIAEGIKVILPDNLVINSVGGRGKWMAKVMPQTAKKFGQVWASDSVCDYLAVPCTALASELTWFDKYLWWKWGREVKWKTVVLSETAYVSELEAPDGAKETILAPGWEEKAYDWFASGSVIREGLNVTVVNATQITGLGTHAARTVETAGMKVAMVKNSEEVIEKCLVKSNDETSQMLGVIWMMKMFNCEARNGEMEKGEIEISLGKEYAKWLLGEDYSSASGSSVR